SLSVLFPLWERCNWRFFTIFFNKMNILIDRTNLRASYNSYQRAADDLKKALPLLFIQRRLFLTTRQRCCRLRTHHSKLPLKDKFPLFPLLLSTNGISCQPNRMFGKAAGQVQNSQTNFLKRNDGEGGC
ncbi:MAG: hypothetical protein ACI8VL_001519, partial [Bacteroidia bacterium]